MPFKIVYIKLMGIATADCEKNKTDLMSVRSGALQLPLLHIIWSTSTNVIII